MKEKNYFYFLTLFLVSSFDQDMPFESNVLSRLEAVMGIQIKSVIANSRSVLTTLFQDNLQVNQRPLPDPRRYAILYLEEAMRRWSMGISNRPHTWRELFNAFRRSSLVELSQKIEIFMSE